MKLNFFCCWINIAGYYFVKEKPPKLSEDSLEVSLCLWATQTSLWTNQWWPMTKIVRAYYSWKTPRTFHQNTINWEMKTLSDERRFFICETELSKDSKYTYTYLLNSILLKRLYLAFIYKLPHFIQLNLLYNLFFLPTLIFKYSVIDNTIISKYFCSLYSAAEGLYHRKRSKRITWI